jgi:poly(A) polymerase
MLEETAVSIVKKLRDHGYESYFAGGCVRDKYMNIEPKDYDIATRAEPHEVAAIFTHTLSVGAHFGVMIVLKGQTQYEVATFRSDHGYSDGRHPDEVRFTTAEEDARRRDFTLNGMLYDPLSGKLVDFVHGCEDIHARIIRAIGDPDTRFSEDYLRMVRAVRFSARFGFSIEPRTLAAITLHASSIVKVSPERIHDELTKILTGPRAGTALRLLHECGLLVHLLKEVADMVGVKQPEAFHPEGSVFNHVCLMLDMLESPSEVLAWSVLLHDVGKPATFYEAKDRIRFHNHNRVGALISVSIAKRLRFSNDLADAVEACVDNHMNFMNVVKMRPSTLKRLLRRPTFIDELELHRLDCLASHGDISNWEFLKEKTLTLKAEEIRPVPLINGKDLIALGYKPGPLFKKILHDVESLQLEDAFSDKQAALEWVQNNFERG